MNSLAQYIELIRRMDNEIPPGEIIMNLNSTIREICNDIQPLFANAEAIADGEIVTYELSDFFGNEGEITNTFMKPRKIETPNGIVRSVNQAIEGDIAYSLSGTQTFHIGVIRQEKLAPLSDGTSILLEYYAYPEPVTLETQFIPLPWAYGLYINKAKADMYAEKRQWDRAGYYSRLYQKNLDSSRRMVRSQGISETINTNTRI